MRDGYLGKGHGIGAGGSSGGIGFGKQGGGGEEGVFDGMFGVEVDPPLDVDPPFVVDPPFDVDPPVDAGSPLVGPPFDVDPPLTVTTTTPCASSTRAAIREVPALIPVTQPSDSTFATAALSLLHSVLDVTSSRLPSVSSANDRSCTREPRDTVDVPAIETSLIVEVGGRGTDAADDCAATGNADGAVDVTGVDRSQPAEIAATTVMIPMTYLMTGTSDTANLFAAPQGCTSGIR